MRFTTKYYYYFAKKAKEVGHSLLSKKSWDVVRIDDHQDTPFSIPINRSAWIKKGLRSLEIAEHAKIIVELIKSMKLSKVVSVGVGCAWLEYNIKKIYPSLHLICTDFAPKTIQRLRELFLECDSIEEFDMLNGEWNSQESTLYLLHRVDTEFDNKQWKKIFSDMSYSNVRYILFVPSGFLTWRIWVSEKKKLLRHRMRRRQISFAGYLRTRDTFRILWMSQYNVKKELLIGKLSGFLLEKK